MRNVLKWLLPILFVSNDCMVYLRYTPSNPAPSFVKCTHAAGCDISCEHYRSCYNATFDAQGVYQLVMYASGDFVLDHAQVICPDNGICSITITGINGGQYARIYCGTNSICEVIGKATSAFYFMEIYAETSNILRITAEGGYQSQYASIRCPRDQPANSEPLCIIQLSSDTSSVFTQGPIMMNSWIYIDKISDIQFQCDAISNFAALFDNDEYSNRLIYHDDRTNMAVCYIKLTYNDTHFYDSNTLGCYSGTQPDIFNGVQCNAWSTDIPLLTTTETEIYIQDVTLSETSRSAIDGDTPFIQGIMNTLGSNTVFWICIGLMTSTCCLAICVLYCICKESHNRIKQNRKQLEDDVQMIIGLKSPKQSVIKFVPAHGHNIERHMNAEDSVSEEVIVKQTTDITEGDDASLSDIYRAPERDEVARTPVGRVSGIQYGGASQITWGTLPTVPSASMQLIKQENVEPTPDGLQRMTSPLEAQNVEFRNVDEGNCAECGKFKRFGVCDGNGLFYCHDCWNEDGNEMNKGNAECMDDKRQNKKHLKKKYHRAPYIDDPSK